MANFNPVYFPLRCLRVAVGLALAVGFGSCVAPSLTAAPVTVAAIQPTRIADLVLIDGGFDADLREGMVCRVTRGGTEIAEVLLVELRPACSAALILSLAPGQSIRPGDLSVKILKS